MTEPMTDERLAEIQASVELLRPLEIPSYPEVTQALLAEVLRLRAALAARPEPIGYVAAVKVHAPYTGTTWLCEDRPEGSAILIADSPAGALIEATDDASDDPTVVYALIPVDGTR